MEKKGPHLSQQVDMIRQKKERNTEGEHGRSVTYITRIWDNGTRDLGRLKEWNVREEPWLLGLYISDHVSLSSQINFILDLLLPVVDFSANSHCFRQILRAFVYYV